MAHVEASVEVEAAPETVWEFISDLKRVPEWDTFCDETLEVSAGAVGAGTWRPAFAAPWPTPSG